MTEPFTERFHRRVNWPPGSWHPPDRRSSHTLTPKTTEYYSNAEPVCVRNFTAIQFQEPIL